jgi:sedoheptulokinase
VTHFYHLKNRSVPSAAATLCTIGDYVAMQLAHQSRPVIDATNGASLGVFDLSARTFDESAIKHAGINTRILPDVVASGTRIGLTSKNIPVYAALGDNQASFIGAVKDIRHSFLVNMGTGGQISTYSSELQRIDALDTRPFPSCGYLLVGASICGGRSYALLKQFFKNVCALFGNENMDDTRIYKIMNTVDSSPAKSENKIVVDTCFQGTRLNPLARGSINNISFDNFTPQQFVTGFLEGSVTELYGFYKKIPLRIRQRIRVMAGSGNGIRENKRLRNIFEKQFGYPLCVPRFKEEAAVGAALCAATGSGVFKDIFEAANQFHSGCIGKS